MMSKKNNEYEKKEVLAMDDDMKEYEETNKIIIDKVAFVYPPSFSYKSIIDTDALRTFWSSIGAIKFYTGRSMEEVELTAKDNSKYYKIMGDKVYYIENNILFISLLDW